MLIWAFLGHELTNPGYDILMDRNILITLIVI
jgi:hypothetical protein